MRVKNAYTATLVMPGGGMLLPGAAGDADPDHHVVRSWLSAGWLLDVTPAPAVDTTAPAPKGKPGK